jgi:hypothetical protein
MPARRNRRLTAFVLAWVVPALGVSVMIHVGQPG